MPTPHVYRLFERACRQSARGHHRAALRTYQRVLVVADEDRFVEWAHWACGEILLRLEDPDAAARHLTEAVRLNPRDASYRRMLGQSYAQGGRWREAVTVLRAAIRLTPRDSEARRLLGWTLVKLGHRSAGKAELARAMFQDKRNLKARLDLAVALSAEGRWEEAVRLARSACRAAPESDSIRQTLQVLEFLRASPPAGLLGPAGRAVDKTE